MKHIRIVALSLTLVLMLGLFTACGKRGSVSESTSDAQSGASTSQSDASTPEQGDVSVPDASQSTQEPEAPEVKPEAKPESKPETKPETKPEPKPDFSVPSNDSDETVVVPMPGTKPEEKPEVPAPEVKPEEKPAGVDLNTFYEGIFTDPANTPALLPMENDTLDAFYPGLTALSLKQKVAYMPMMTAVPCEIVMVECANAADVDTVKSLFRSRIDAQVNDQSAYPMVIEAWETEAKVVSNGNFVALFVVSGMTDQVVSNFNALF